MISEHWRGRRQLAETEVAFSAQISENVNHLGQDQVVVFDKALTDLDGTSSPDAYSTSSGIFTAPLNGVYVFSVTMHSLTRESTHFAIYKNTQQITTIYVHGADTTTTDSTSQTVVLVLKRGDMVSIRHTESDHGAFGYGHSLFSGFLLYVHGSDPELIG